MNDKIFLDTNLWLYLYSKDDFNKKNKVEALVSSHEHIFVSTQVLNELANVLIRKKNVSIAGVRQVFFEIMQVASLQMVTVDTLKSALDTAERLKYSYFDSLIIASALEINCSKLYSEDLHNNHIVEKKLEIINPFK